MRISVLLTFLFIAATLFSAPAPTPASPPKNVVKLDTVAPFVQVDMPSGLYNRSLEVHFTLNEQATVFYTLDGSAPTEKSMEYSGFLSITNEGKTQLRFVALDMVGNRSKEGSAEYLIDTHAPKVDVTPPPGVYPKDIEVKLLTSEPSKLFFSLNGKPEEPYKNRLLITKPCTLTAYATDDAGNKSDLLTAVYSFERAIPVVASSHESGLYNKVFKLTLTSSPTVRIKYSFDEFAPMSSFQLYTKPLPVKAGQTIVSYYGENNLGVRSDLVKAVFTVDVFPPKVSALLKVVGDKRTIQLRASEKAVMTYTLDGSEPSETSTPYSGPIVIPKTGSVVLRVFARDGVGNSDNGFKQNFTSDGKPPQVSLSPAPGLYRMPFRITITTPESARIFYTLDNSLPGDGGAIYSAPIPVTKDGRITVTCIAVDDNDTRSGFVSATYVLDQTPPKVVPKLTRLEDGKSFSVSFDLELGDGLYYTSDGTEPSFLATRYDKPFTVKAGGRVRYFAADSAGNKTPIVELSEIALPSIKADPPGGIFRNAVRVKLTANLPGRLFYRMRSKNTDKGDFLVYQEPLFLNANGLYKIEYYTENQQGTRSTISEETYFIDLFPPEINVYTKRNVVDSTITLFFQSSENASIYYTTDGTNPGTSPTAQVIGNKYFLAKDKLVFPMRDNIRVSFIAEDLAGNRSELYQFDANLPTVLSSPPEGRYNEILHVVLTSFNDATIYYTVDGSDPTERSPVYRTPVPITRTTVLRYFAVDQYGYKGVMAGGEYQLDLPPKPEFSVSPEPPLEGITLEFNASASVDEESGTEGLRFRWDFDGDGKFDTPWLSDPHASTFYRSAGIRRVTLEVSDKGGLVSKLERVIQVHKDCPKGMVSLFDNDRAFCIDQFEFPNSRDSLPLTGIAWVEAVMRCRSVGKELCRFSEWNAACKGRGRTGQDFPYGQEYEPSFCNTEGDAVEPSGERKKCSSSSKVYDLTGNAWEWVLDRDSGYNRIVGGDFSYGKNARCDAVFPELLSRREKSVGFRCCK